MYWFRSLNPEHVRAGTLTVSPREVYALSYNTQKKIFTLTKESGDSTTLNDTIFIDSLLSKSRPMTNKDSITKPTAAKIIKESADAIPDNPVATGDGGPNSGFIVKEISLVAAGGIPLIPKSFPPGLVHLTEEIIIKSSIYSPISDKYKDMVDKALHYIGSKVTTKCPKFALCQSVTNPTSLVQYLNKNVKINGKTVPHTYLILNFPQLARLGIGSTVTPSIIAQAITHEFAHYIWYAGIVKQTEKIKFKQMLAGKGIHPDIFKHPGYSYPWFEEAWAVLCEYMVHGRSARGLTVTDGWEFAQNYFDNNYLKGGVPTGTAPVRVKR